MQKPSIMRVNGPSMIPCLHPNDIIYITDNPDYTLGDILVYKYEHSNNILLVHRLLQIKDTCFLCKGDNAFRIDRIIYEDIIGKVVLIKRGDTLLHPKTTSQTFIEDSLNIGVLFESLGNSIDKLVNTDEYKRYHTMYLHY